MIASARAKPRSISQYIWSSAEGTTPQVHLCLKIDCSKACCSVQFAAHASTCNMLLFSSQLQLVRSLPMSVGQHDCHICREELAAHERTKDEQVAASHHQLQHMSRSVEASTPFLPVTQRGMHAVSPIIIAAAAETASLAVGTQCTRRQCPLSPGSACSPGRKHSLT